jgi:hypothetical protein
MIGRGNRSTRRKPAPVPLCPPQTPHAARTRTRPAAVGSQCLTAWATARPKYQVTFSGSRGGRMGRRWYRTSRPIYICLWKEERESWISYRFFVRKEITLTIKTVQFVSDRMSYIILRGCWCDIHVLNIHDPTEDKIGDVKDSTIQKFC